MVVWYVTIQFYVLHLHSSHLYVCVGRVDPVPFELKDDYLGLGRWTMEVSSHCVFL